MAEFIRKAVKLGNSSGIILPKKFLGSEVKVIVISRPFNIKKEVLKLLDEHLADILGIYIINKKPVEIIAATSNLKQSIEENKIKISLIPIQEIKNNLILRKKLFQAETIVNKHLLLELKKYQLKRVITRL